MAPESTTNTEYINQKDFLTASKWFNNILDIGGFWDLDLDEIRRHYMCELYSGGQDLLAHEVCFIYPDPQVVFNIFQLLTVLMCSDTLYKFKVEIHYYTNS